MVAEQAQPSSAAPKKRVLVPIATGSEEIETACIVDVLRRAGADVVLASASGEELEVTMSRNMVFKADCSLTEELATQKTFDLIALPGGMPGAKQLSESSLLNDLLLRHSANGGLVAAICAAPVVVLQPLGLLADRASTAHPAFSQQLPSQLSVAGRVLVDGNLITSRGPGSALEFALALVSTLYGDEKALELAGPLVLPPASPAQLVPNEWRLPAKPA